MPTPSSRDPGAPGGTPARPAVFFADGAQLRAWFEVHHDTTPELWMGYWKKHTGRGGLAWADAVAEALCFGWIDSVVQRIDDDSTRQRWTPRKPGSTWSNANVATVERLMAEGRLRPAGLAAFERRRADRTGTYSFESDTPLALPPEYAQRLAASAAAQTFWDLSTPSYRRVATHWVLSAKQRTTRDRRVGQLVADSTAGRLIPPQRYGAEPAWVQRAREAMGIKGAHPS